MSVSVTNYEHYRNPRLISVESSEPFLTGYELNYTDRGDEIAEKYIKELNLPPDTKVDWRDPHTLWLWVPE